MKHRQLWFYSGLFLATVATLVLEILDTRLLSVVTWYHLSFFAVSAAIFGMAAGAVRIYLGGQGFAGENARFALARYGMLFAISIPVSHIANLCIPIQAEISVNTVCALAITTVVFGIPFYLSGIVVAISLTRIPGRIGTVYSVDLIGAAIGSLLVLFLLTWGNISSCAFACGAIAALSAACFRRFAGVSRPYRELGLAVALLAISFLNNASARGIRVEYLKGNHISMASIAHESWSIHGRVTAGHKESGPPEYWGKGEGAEDLTVDRVDMTIDGGAYTVMTGWDGDPRSLDWVQYDVTALPYHIRRGGDVAIIGVGGGRDILTALWADSLSVTGIEIHETFIDLLQGPLRDFARLADHPRVRLVHDEARSYLTRTEDRYDVLHMSLIDTWAATGAGAFTLSENGLYTVEAWDVFLRVLKPGGVFSVSRWYAPERASETSKLLALGTAALLRHGAEDVHKQMVLISRGLVATLLLSTAEFTNLDLATLSDAAQRFDFRILLAPGHQPHEALLGKIASCKSTQELALAVAHKSLDYAPPTDERPYFFNILKPGALLRGDIDLHSPGIGAGNLLATLTLIVLTVVSAALVLLVIFVPLVRSGFPRMGRGSFVQAIVYFSIIGTGFMLIQIGFMQRFSVYLGHPVYAVSIILFSMILSAGLGSLFSDRIPVESSLMVTRIIPLAVSILVLVVTFCIQPVIEATIQYRLLVRCLVVCGLVVPTGAVLGMCFPVGLRLVSRISRDAMPWLWGVNGACSVLATVVAVALSMWSGIQTSFYVAVIAYAFLAVPATILWRAGANAPALSSDSGPEEFELADTPPELIPGVTRAVSSGR